MSSSTETRTGLKDLGYTEGFAWDPMLFGIVSKPPPKDLQIKITCEVGDIPERTYTFGAVDIVGPNDRHEPGLGWDATFRWAQQSEAAKSDLEQQVVALLNGADPKRVECHHEKGMPYLIVTDGRHTVLAERLANLIRKKLKIEPDKYGFTRHKLSEASAATFARRANKHYERSKEDEIEQNVYEIHKHGWTDEQAARVYGKSASTIRAWRLRAEGKTRKTEQKRERTGLRKPQQKAFFEALKKKASDASYSDIEGALMTAEAFVYGKLPDDAPVWLKAAWKAAQNGGES